MAVKKTIVKSESVVEVKKFDIKKYKWVGVVVTLVLVLVVFWWRTNTWPIVGFVGLRPITRFEVDQELFKQGGKSIIDNIVTQNIVESELASKKIVVSDTDVDVKLGEIKSQLGAGTTIEQVLADSGMTLADAKKQLKLQMGIEKAVSAAISVTQAEVDEYIKTNGASLTGTDEEKKLMVEKYLGQQKVQTAIAAWIEGLRSKAKVWLVK